MFRPNKRREYLAGWLWEMHARSWHEEQRLRSLAKPEEARHYQRQAKIIGELLARMTATEHPRTR